MKRLTSFLGIAALFFAGVGMVTFLLEAKTTFLSQIHFGLAMVGILLFAATHFKDIILSLKQRTTRFGALVSVYSLIVFAMFIAVNAVGAITNRQIFDLTEKGIYTLSPLTEKIVSGLDSELKIYAFFRGGRVGLENERAVDRLLNSMKSISKRIVIEPVDPMVDPLFAEKHKVYANGVLVLEFKGKTRKVNTVTEQSVTNALIRLYDDRDKTVCFTSGHGEPPIESTDSPGGNYSLSKLTTALREMDYTVRAIDIKSEGRIPDDCTVMAVVGPRTPLNPGELVILDYYLQKGGRLLTAADASLVTNLEPLLARWGIAMANDLVVEKIVEGTVSGPEGFKPTSVRPSFDITVVDYEKSNVITQDLSVVHPTQYLVARSIRPYQSSTPELKVVPLIRSKPESWSEKDYASALNNTPPTFDVRAGDSAGPVTLAASGSLNVQSVTEPLRGYSYQARLAAFGNAYWLTNFAFDQSRNFNRDLASNVFGWLAGFEQFLAIPPKMSAAKTLELDYSQKSDIFNLIVILIPEGLLMMGALVWWLRR